MSRPRCQFDLTPRQKAYLDALPHGMKQQIYSAFTDLFIDLIERHGSAAIGYIISKTINLEDLYVSE